MYKKRVQPDVIKTQYEEVCCVLHAMRMPIFLDMVLVLTGTEGLSMLSVHLPNADGTEAALF